MAIDSSGAGALGGGDGFNFGSAAGVGVGSGGVGINMGSGGGGTGGENVGLSDGRGGGRGEGGSGHLGGGRGGDSFGTGGASAGRGGDALGRGTGGGAVSSGDSGGGGLRGGNIAAIMAIDSSGAGALGRGDGLNIGSAAGVGVGSGGVGINMGLDVVGGDMGIVGTAGGGVGIIGGHDGVGFDVVSSNIGGGRVGGGEGGGGSAGGPTGARTEVGIGFDGASIGDGGGGFAGPFGSLNGVSGDIAVDASSVGGGSAGLSGGLGGFVGKSGNGGSGDGSGGKAGKAGGGIGNMAVGFVHDGQQVEREVVEISGGGAPGKKVVFVKERDNEDNDKKYYVTTTISATRGGGGGGKGASDGTVSGGASLGGVGSSGVGVGGVGNGGISGGDMSALDMILSGGSGGGNAGSAVVNGVGGNVERISGNAGIGGSGPGGDAQGINIGRPSLKTDVGGPSLRMGVGGLSLGIDVVGPSFETVIGGPSIDAKKPSFGGGSAEPAINIGVVGGSGTMFDVRDGRGGINGGVDAVMGVVGRGGGGRGDGGGIGVGSIGGSGSGGGGGGEGLGSVGIGGGIGDAYSFGGAGSRFNILEGGGRGGGGSVGATGGFEIDVGMRRSGGASAVGGDIGGFSQGGVIIGGGKGGIGRFDLGKGGDHGMGGTDFGVIRENEGTGGGVEAKYFPMGNDGVVFANVPQANIQGSITSGGPISISIPDIVIDPGQLQRMEGGSLSGTIPVSLGSGSGKSEVKVMVVVSVPLIDAGAFGGDGSIGASEALGKLDFSFNQKSGSMMFDGNKMFNSNMTTTTLSSLKVDIDKSKDDEKLKTKIKLQRGNGDWARKAEIKVKQKLEDDEKVKIKIETKLPGLDGRKETEIKLEGETGMNIKVPGMDVGLKIQESGVKVIDLAKPKSSKSVDGSLSQLLVGGPGDSASGASINGPVFGADVPSMTDRAVGRADPSVGAPASRFNGPSLPDMTLVQPDFISAPSIQLLSGTDFGPQSGPILPAPGGPSAESAFASAAAIASASARPAGIACSGGNIGPACLLPAPGGPSAEAAFASAAAIASASVPNTGPGRDVGPAVGHPDILPGIDLLSSAVLASVAEPVPIVQDSAFGPVHGPVPEPDPLPVPAPNPASGFWPDTAPALVPLPVPGPDPGLVASVTAPKTTDDTKEKKDNKDGSRLKSALQDLVKALQNIKSTKIDLISPNPDPLTVVITEHSPVREPAPEPIPASAQVLTPRLEPALNLDFEGLCLGSIGTFVDGVGYAKYPGECEKFLQCYYVGATVRPVIRKCPYGLFWDQALMLCRRPDDVFCPEDPCFTGKKHYHREGGCNSYYQCVNGVSTPKCCGAGFKYNDNNECVSDTVDTDKCDDQCETSDAVVQRLGSSTCNSMEDGSNIYGYINLEHGGLRFRACPFGTTYNPMECRCSARYSSSGSSLTISKPRQRSCRPEFSMNFDDGFLDLSDGNTAFSFMGCYIDRGTVSFAGAGHMTLWGFTGRFYGSTFGIKMRIKPDKGSRKKSETIISNCGYDGEPTISVCWENDKIKMTAIVTGSANPMVIEDFCDDDTWCEIIYYFNGKNFVGGVGKNRHSLPCGGILKSNGNPLMIGGCNNGSGFNGLIDDVNIYTMCIPGDF